MTFCKDGTLGFKSEEMGDALKPYTSPKIDASFGNSDGCFCVSMTLKTPPFICNGWTSDVWRRVDFNVSKVSTFP